ncbi:MAG TPA: wax ester/triacylglycerol synthase domain-containing protein [Acidimicrobiales bacterium]|nr:wax ester/triacylglycerol synthase domain-containing protein [Acidimicrobiales bacterium]
MANLSDTEALMWSVERDPVLRSTFLNVTFLDRGPDVARFRRRMAAAVQRIPRLRQRIDSPGLGRPAAWVDDPDFDLEYHVRHAALPGAGTDRQLLDDAALGYQDAFDPSRPLWQLTIVEGLEGGRAALLAKMHHTITDGVGGVRMSAMFLDIERDATDEPALDPGPAAESPSPGVFDTVRRLGGELLNTARDPLAMAQSLSRQILVTDQSKSPLWQGKRSMGRRFDTLRVDLPAAKAAATQLGGTINDLYVAGVSGGVGAYHRACGVPVDELRMSMPVSTRTDKSAGGNAFAPSRVVVPVDIEHPVERFNAVQARLNEVKGERALNVAGSLSGLLTSLPSPLLVRLARQQVETVDFACSNVRGAPFDLYVAGGLVEANYPMGPTAGTACNVTLLSYRGSMDIGVNSDTAAVDQPEVLASCIETSLNEVIAAGS